MNKQFYADYCRAELFIQSGLLGGSLDTVSNGRITRQSLQTYLFNAGYLIRGFNDHMQQPEPLPIAKAPPQITKIADSKEDDFEYSANNILKRNEIKKDLQAMARIIATHLWANDTEKTRIGEMADKVHREVGKFAPASYMPETTKSVADWIRCVAPDYASKEGPTKTSERETIPLNEKRGAVVNRV